MINDQLLNPKSISIIGGSNNTKKPGGKIVKNILDGNYGGLVYIVNPKETNVQGIKCYKDIRELPSTDLAILAIPAKLCLNAVTILAENKNTKAFIIISAGFAEANEEGKQIEMAITNIVNSVNGCLIGPNCIGVINNKYKGVFTTPIPKFEQNGCDLISSSGATAVFIMEAGIPLGVKFANIYSLGNASQTSAEDVLEYMDKNYNPDKDLKIKLLYLETIKNPKKLQKHASSLIKKGVKIAAIKAGVTAEGSRAAMSHTGAIASSDVTIRALFKKCGIVYCSGREELLSVASIFNYKKPKGNRFAIITHAGGSAVMLTDVLSKGGLEIPKIEGKLAEELCSYLNSGSSVSNPIDFLATGTAKQLAKIIDYCDNAFDIIDAMIVVFGSPGLFNINDVYTLLDNKINTCSKPIYPVLPSVINAHSAIKYFVDKGNIYFADEVVLGQALVQTLKTLPPSTNKGDLPSVDKKSIRQIIKSNCNGFLSPKDCSTLLKAANIPIIEEIIISTKNGLQSALSKIAFPIVMKAVGPIHKTDVNGVVLNIGSLEEAFSHYDALIRIPETHSVLIQPMVSGLELYIGVKKEENFNHTILCGLGGIYVEILNDIAAGLSPLSKTEVERMVRSLKGYKIIKGTRGSRGINEDNFIEIIQRISALVEAAPEIIEMDINPLIANSESIVAVDVRIKIEKFQS